MLEFIEADGTCARLAEKTGIIELVKRKADYEQIYAVVINGKLHDLNYVPRQGGTLTYIRSDSKIGKMIYERTLSFVFIAAVHALDPKAHVNMEHTLSSGQYCEVERKPFFTPHDVSQIEAKMHEIINAKAKITRRVMDTATVIDHFRSHGMMNKAALLECRKSKKSSLYELCGCEDYFYGLLLPNAGYITRFSLRYYAPGVWLSAQPQFINQKKMFAVFQEYGRWGKAIGVSNVAQLNQKISAGKMDELVLMCETMMEKQLTKLAAEIVEQHATTKFILIAGPSSAGKTTFSKRLAIHLKILGVESEAISMDDFYKNREDTPKLPDGSYDFESVHAINLELLEQMINQLTQGLPVKLPHFNFKTGKSEMSDRIVCLKEKQVLIIEGIHGLNPYISDAFAKDAVFKIYINALTHLNLDEHNRIPTSDYRLIRRITRDHQTRGWSAADTISFWANVRTGEDRNIYPYQESADYIFNTSMVYELAVLKKLALPLLNAIKKDSEHFLEANRLKKLLAYFADGASDAIPRYSILAEFVGNSILDVS